MRYWYPFTEEATDKILEDGINRLVIIPLYPQYSISTTGSSIRLLEQILDEDNQVSSSSYHMHVSSSIHYLRYRYWTRTTRP